jgi:phosphopantetheine adenylyltransferase
MKHLHCSRNELIFLIQKTFKSHDIMIPNKLLKKIFDNYHKNPFHNIKHAYEVFETMHNLLRIVNVEKQFTLVDETILLLTALCHDINHQGKTNKFLKQGSIESMIKLYNDAEDFEMDQIKIERNRSYDNLFDVETFDALNEKTHQDITMKLIRKYKIFNKNLDTYVENFVQSLILSTDLNLHDTYLQKFDINNKFSLGTLLMKIADLSHPTETLESICIGCIS